MTIPKSSLPLTAALAMVLAVAPVEAQSLPVIGLSQGAEPLAAVRASEAKVRQQPLSERPNRIGHFYGNTVRRVQQGRLCVNCGKHARPVARFFYITR